MDTQRFRKASSWPNGSYKRFENVSFPTNISLSTSKICIINATNPKYGHQKAKTSSQLKTTRLVFQGSQLFSLAMTRSASTGASNPSTLGFSYIRRTKWQGKKPNYMPWIRPIKRTKTLPISSLLQRMLPEMSYHVAGTRVDHS